MCRCVCVCEWVGATCLCVRAAADSSVITACVFAGPVRHQAHHAVSAHREDKGSRCAASLLIHRDCP